MINKDQQIDLEIRSKRNALRNVYRTEEGLYELARTLRECGVFDTVECSPEAVALYNFGIRKLEDLGLMDEESLIPMLKWMLEGDWKTPIEWVGEGDSNGS